MVARNVKRDDWRRFAESLDKLDRLVFPHEISEVLTGGAAAKVFADVNHNRDTHANENIRTDNATANQARESDELKDPRNVVRHSALIV